jgi:hypothetical protein
MLKIVSFVESMATRHSSYIRRVIKARILGIRAVDVQDIEQSLYAMMLTRQGRMYPGERWRTWLNRLLNVVIAEHFESIDRNGMLLDPFLVDDGPEIESYNKAYNE